MKKILFALWGICVSVASYSNEDSLKAIQTYNDALQSLKTTLESDEQPDFKNALFTIENAYWDNRFNAKGFDFVLNYHLSNIRGLIKANDRSDTMNFEPVLDFSKPLHYSGIEFTADEKRKLYKDALANWAIFKYLTDTTYIGGEIHLPFRYNIKDPFGQKDWRASQVLNLLETGTGNCFAFASLFKIFSDELDSEAKICVAPSHIYIQHKDHKGDWYNVELSSGTFPSDGSIQTLTYTYLEGIKSGISIRQLSEKELVTLCAVYLGKSYQYKFGDLSNDFILECSETAINYDTNNLNAMLLKHQVLSERVIKNEISQENKKGAFHIKDRTSESFINLEKLTLKLFDKGYHQMPLYMQEMILKTITTDDPIIVKNRTPRAFKNLDVPEEDKRFSTLSGGLFEELHTIKEFEPYGRFIFDTKNRELTKIDLSLSNEMLIDPVAFAWQIDPLAHEMPGWSPYSINFDNPILNIDPDGRFPYTFHVRSFAPTGAFKGWGFEDDKRGYSAASNPSSRIEHSFTIDPSAGTYNQNYLRSDPSINDEGKSLTGSPRGGFYPKFDGKGGASFSQEFEGNNPHYWYSPDIEVSSAFNIIENTKDGTLTITGSAASKRFPATEVLIGDSKGNNLFLGVGSANGDPGDLVLAFQKQIFETGITVNIDNKGVFQSVQFNDQTYSLDEWNKQFTSQSAGPNER